jgi:hypothetical protein
MLAVFRGGHILTLFQGMQTDEIALLFTSAWCSQHPSKEPMIVEPTIDFSHIILTTDEKFTS